MQRVELPKDVLTFLLGEKHYGIDVRRVLDVHALPAPLRIAGGLVGGYITIDGKPLPVLDRRQNSSASVCPMEHPVKVLVLNGSAGRFALAVDQVGDLVRLHPTWVEPANDESCQMGTRYIVEVSQQSPKISVACVDRLFERARGTAL